MLSLYHCTNVNSISISFSGRYTHWYVRKHGMYCIHLLPNNVFSFWLIQMIHEVTYHLLCHIFRSEPQRSRRRSFCGRFVACNSSDFLVSAGITLGNDRDLERLAACCPSEENNDDRKGHDDIDDFAHCFDL
jgi:hypothetical protein